MLAALGGSCWSVCEYQWGASCGAGPQCVSGVKESQQQSKELNLHFPSLLLCANPWTRSYSGLLILSLHQIQCEGSRERGWFCMYETLQRLSLGRQRVGKETFYWWLDLSCIPVNAFKKGPWWAGASIVMSHVKWLEELSQPRLCTMQWEISACHWWRVSCGDDVSVCCNPTNWKTISN